MCTYNCLSADAKMAKIAQRVNSNRLSYYDSTSSALLTPLTPLRKYFVTKVCGQAMSNDI